MIFDSLENLKFYRGLHQNLDKAIDYISQNNLADFKYDTYSVDEKNVFFFVQENHPLATSSDAFEYHESYVDLHFLRKGKERVKFGVGFEEQVEVYDAKRDFASASCEFDVDFEMDEEHFILFMPGELHQPNLAVDGYSTVEKCVFKILLD